MKKLDKLVILSFFSPFFLTFFVVIFILLLQFLLKYFDELVGKGLGWDIYGQLLGYFAINMTPNAFPLAVLLSSLMTFGNLGEYSELTAVKGAGISLNRLLIPIFVISIFLTVIAYLSNNYVVPKANLKAYSLLWDIKNKTPALNLKEGTFYGDIPGFQIKVNKKFSDGRSLKDIIIYNHEGKTGNKEVTLADSGQMYMILNDRYLVMELFNGRYYAEQEEVTKNKRRGQKPTPFARSEFEKSKVVFSMASFDLKRTKEELFKGNRLMKNVHELRSDIDSMQKELLFARYEAFVNIKQKFNLLLDDQLQIPEELKPENYGYENKINNPLVSGRINSTIPTNTPLNENVTAREMTTDTLVATIDNTGTTGKSMSRRPGRKRIEFKDKEKEDLPEENRQPWSRIGADSILHGNFNQKEISKLAVSSARFVKKHFMVASGKVQSRKAEIRTYRIQENKIISQAVACIIMFLIGAPLGAIIKKGGLGFPVIVSIGFFIIYYVLMIMGEKWAKQEMLDPITGVWLPNLLLLPFGFFFLRQASRDAKLFDTDFYLVVFDQVINKLKIYTWASKKKESIHL